MLRRVHKIVYNLLENEGILESTHHPFTAPLSEDIPILANCSSKSELLQIRGQHYDLVVSIPCIVLLSTPCIVLCC